jgi:hypothetical protein
MTVEGSYQNIRRFIREIETGSDFVVVSAVELEPSDTEGSTDKQPGDPSQPGAASDPNSGLPIGLSGKPIQNAGTQTSPRNKGKTHGEVVSLRLEMAAYFRRPNVMPQMPAPTEQ